MGIAYLVETEQLVQLIMLLSAVEIKNIFGFSSKDKTDQKVFENN